ncbi:glycosyl transferase family 2 [Flavobacterium rivuli WB 3.3-2 = DSM 21788]|uniref:Glycosyl transferase family 2 n=1 Tax=Flavobacterium rivuli WB 3.3-2 = DSM 21788 TaxID=1121895 RepID=A0A0A2M3A1_9FLAO|nr:glycosyltransferase [Flavobacterium rivuli]KGO86724.1 glycosyl transferase family 2 [Flavobacterium rivuli WB 3.3-2 = DSM 21788]
MFFSLIIPVYNRPDEIEELLESLTRQVYTNDYEVVVIEDGSSVPCSDVIAKYDSSLNISYYFKPNSGPGDSRNYGMQKAQGDYFIILDSDCIIPPQYLQSVDINLEAQYTDCFGGPDGALNSFSDVQKAINFSMTSFLTTGGIRGKSETIEKFQPRSFNMGISKAAFIASQGFGNIHPGEDPDLSIRLWKLGYTTKLFTDSYVYHKRRINWDKFYIQVNKFGKARPILDKWHPEYKKITFLFPSFFIAGLAGSLILMLINVHFFFYLYILYFAAVFVLSSVANKNVKVGLLSVAAVFIQFYGYGTGYINSFIKINLLKQQPQQAFPELFF